MSHAVILGPGSLSSVMKQQSNKTSFDWIIWFYLKKVTENERNESELNYIRPLSTECLLT